MFGPDHSDQSSMFGSDDGSISGGETNIILIPVLERLIDCAVRVF